MSPLDLTQDVWLRTNKAIECELITFTPLQSFKCTEVFDIYVPEQLERSYPLLHLPEQQLANYPWLCSGGRQSQ